VLAAQYESWKLPLAIVLIVPMCLLASATGLAFRGMPIDILAQIGFVVLVGLAASHPWDLPAKTRFASDSPLEEGVSSEPVSAWRFPGNREKCRELHYFRLSSRLFGSKT
jgi:AcrB/AcrD/AcrF family